MDDSKERETACDGNVEIPVSGSKIYGVDTVGDSSVSHNNDTTSARGLSVDHSPAPLPPSLTAFSSVTASGSGVEGETQDMSGSLLECLNLSLEEIRAHRVCIGRGGIKRSRPDSRISDSTCDLSGGNAKTGAVKRKKKVRTVSSLSADRDAEGRGDAVPQPDSTFDFQSSHAEEQETYALKRHADTYDGEEMEVEAEVEEDSADEDNDGDVEGDGCVVVSPSSQHHLDSPSESDLMSQRRARAMMLASRLASSSLSSSLPVSASPSLKDSRMERGQGMGMGMETDECHEVSCTDDSSSVATLTNVAGEREECDTFPHDHACSNKVGERGGGGGEDDKVRDIGEDADDPLRYREEDMSERRESGSIDGDRIKMSSSELHTVVTKNPGIQGSKSSSEHSNKNANGREKDRDGDGKPRYVYRESKYILSK